MLERMAGVVFSGRVSRVLIAAAVAAVAVAAVAGASGRMRGFVSVQPWGVDVLWRGSAKGPQPSPQRGHCPHEGSSQRRPTWGGCVCLAGLSAGREQHVHTHTQSHTHNHTQIKIQSAPKAVCYKSCV